MEPRLESSTKSTPLPADAVKPVIEAIKSNFKAQLKGRDVVVEGHIYLEEITVRIGLIEKGSIKPTNFDASINHSPKKKDAMNKLYLALDALGSMVQQYFDADGDIELPKEWHEFQLEGDSVFLKTSSDNSSLEDQANKILEGE